MTSFREVARTAARVKLAALLGAAGVAHLTILRRGFRITVPDWATKVLRTDKVCTSGAPAAPRRHATTG